MEWHIIASAAAAVITFLALIFELRRERRKQTLELKADFRAALDQVSKRIDKIEQEDITLLHRRVSETRNYEREIIATVSEVQGQLKALNNITQVVYAELLKRAQLPVAPAPAQQ